MGNNYEFEFLRVYILTYLHYCTIATKKTEIGYNLTNDVKGLYTETIKHRREILKKIYNKWRDTSFMNEKIQCCFQFFLNSSSESTQSQ